MNRRLGAVVLGVVASLLIASTALGHECVNASKKNQGAGAQVVIDATTGEIVWTTVGLEKRFGQGLVDPVTGEGYHGIIGLDFDGDGLVDVGTFIVGVADEIPLNAQFNGPACRGITNIDLFFSQCFV
jgi:hypothetical protein